MVVDGQAQEPYDGILAGSPIFSPDSQRLAYGATLDNQWFVNVDGQEQPRYDSIAADSLRFSPDSKHLAYAAQTGDNWFVSVDGEAEQPYDGIITLGGGRIVFDSPQTFHYLGVKRADIYLVGGKVKN